MHTMKNLLSGRAAAAAAAAASVSAASSSTAQARAPVAQAAPHQEVGKRPVEDEWLVTDHQPGGDVILFKPFQPWEVDNAFADIATAVHAKRSAAAAELQDGAASGASTPTSDGSNANSAIMRTCLTGSSMYGGSFWAEEVPSQADSGGMDMMKLLAVTNKMLKRPGMQAEIVKAMMEDREIRSILLREGDDLDEYLIAAGAAPAASLLPAAAVACLEGGTGAGADATAGEASDGSGNLLSNLVHAMLSALGHTGSTVGRLLDWLRSRFAALPGVAHEAAPGEAAADADAGAGAGAGAPHVRRGLPVFWQRVLTVATVVAVVVIFKRPVASFVRLGAGRAGVAAAAAGAAAWAGSAAAAAGHGTEREGERAGPPAAGGADDARDA